MRRSAAGPSWRTYGCLLRPRGHTRVAAKKWKSTGERRRPPIIRTAALSRRGVCYFPRRRLPYSCGHLIAARCEGLDATSSKARPLRGPSRCEALGSAAALLEGRWCERGTHVARRAVVAGDRSVWAAEAAAPVARTLSPWEPSCCEATERCPRLVLELYTTAARASRARGCPKAS